MHPPTTITLNAIKTELTISMSNSKFILGAAGVSQNLFIRTTSREFATTITDFGVRTNLFLNCVLHHECQLHVLVNTHLHVLFVLLFKDKWIS